MSDSYPARVMGRILGHHNIEIESIEVDTRSFYQ
jgi:hypothetical protein